MFSGAFHWWYLGSLKRTQHSIIKCYPTLTLNMYTCAWICFLWRGLTKSYALILCLFTLDGLFDDSLSGTMETTLPTFDAIHQLNLFKFWIKPSQVPAQTQNTRNAREIYTNYTRAFNFCVKEKHKCQSLPFSDFTGIFSAVNGLFWIQVALKPQQLFTWKSDKKTERDMFGREIWSFNASCLYW